MHGRSEEFEDVICSKLARSSLFLTFQAAFRAATGLPLELVGRKQTENYIPDGSPNHHPFCETLHRLSPQARQACVEANGRLVRRAADGGPVSCRCFARLSLTVIPVRAENSVIGFLKTGQAATAPLETMRFEEVLGSIGRRHLDEPTVALLRRTYFEGGSLTPERYAGAVGLLRAFAEQLERHAENLVTYADGSEPPAVMRAREYIHSHLGSAITLARIARHAGLSESYLCRLFRESTGQTITHYTTHCRVEWAKHELLKPGKRISEIAFDVGYHSISQFNRDFQRFEGTSPTAWRRARLSDLDPNRPHSK